MKTIQVGKTHKADQPHGKTQLNTRCEKKEQHKNAYDAYDRSHSYSPLQILTISKMNTQHSRRQQTATP